MRIPTHEPDIYLEVRDNLNDFQIVREIFCEDVYRAKPYLNEETETIVDIGSCFGAFSVWAHKFAPNAKIYAVEPEPDNLKLLGQNVLDRIKIYPKAVSDFNGKANISNKGGESRLGGEGAKVDVVTFQSLGFEAIDILKLDTEGSEWRILKEIPKACMERIKYICMEFEQDMPNIVYKLAETHSVTVLGHGMGYIYATRY